MRWIVRIFGILLVLVALAVGALFVIPSERIAKLATDQFEARTGRALSISGAVRPTVWPKIGVRAEGISLANAPWSDRGPMLTAESLSVGVDVMALIGGAVQVERLELVRPKVLLERAADGRANWELGAAPAPTSQTTNTSSSSGGLPPFSLALGTIRDGTVIYLDHASDLAEQITALDLEARIPNLEATTALKGSALYRTGAMEFEGTVTSLARLVEGALAEVALRGSVGGTALEISGQGAVTPLGFQGQIDLDSGERTQVFQMLGQVAPDLPKGLGQDRITLQSTITLASEGSVHLRDMTLALDGNRVTGAMDLFVKGARPKIVADLSAGALDLIGLSQEGRGGSSAGPGSSPAQAGWSDARIDVSALSALDADITVKTGAIELGDARLDRVSARAQLDAGRAVVRLSDLALYGGTIVGDVVINGRGGLSSRADLRLAGLQMQPLLTQFIDYDRLVGTADGQINVLAVGNSMAALMRSLDGAGSFSIGRGEILGLDLGGMVRNLDTSFRGEGSKTIFDGIKASFALNEGTLRNEDLDFKAPILTATGKGQVNIGAQTLDYRVEPVAFGTETGAGVRVPVQITGPWANPSFRPDLGALLENKLGVSEADVKAQAETKAKDRVREVISKELDVAPEGLNTRQDVENAVKERLQKEIGGALLGILGGN